MCHRIVIETWETMEQEPTAVVTVTKLWRTQTLREVSILQTVIVKTWLVYPGCGVLAGSLGCYEHKKYRL